MTAGITIVDGHVEGRDQAIPVRDYLPHRPSGRALLWVHGGGFTGGGLDQGESDAPARALAASGRRVRTVDYRLVSRRRRRRPASADAVANRYPAAHHDVIDAAKALRDEAGGDVFLGGGSAGANLVAGAALALRDEGDSLAAGLVLAYGSFHGEPLYDPEVERDLRSPIAKLLFRNSTLRRIHLHYVGDDALLAPGYAFPGGSDLRGMPASVIIDARNDRLRSSGRAFARELRNSGVPVDEHVVEDWHGFLGLPSRRAFADGIHLIRSWLDAQDAKPAG